MPSDTPYKDHIQKFKLLRKDSERDAARVRENQRRHRARVKSHIEELETTLETTKSKLDEALQRIDDLNTQVQQLKHALELSGRTPPPSNPSSAPSSASSQSLSSSDTESPFSLHEELHLGTVQTNQGPMDHDTLSKLLDTQQPDPQNTDLGDCPFLRPSSPGESTMLCREAYRIIGEHLSGVDFEMATESLKPGFRRATDPGSGCRVQTHILFSFVDRIT